MPIGPYNYENPLCIGLYNYGDPLWVGLYDCGDPLVGWPFVETNSLESYLYMFWIFQRPSIWGYMYLDLICQRSYMGCVFWICCRPYLGYLHLVLDLLETLLGLFAFALDLSKILSGLIIFGFVFVRDPMWVTCFGFTGDPKWVICIWIWIC